MPLPLIHDHPNPLQTLARHLLPHLPHSLALFRRLQFHHSPPSAYVLATFPPNLSLSPQSFSATYVDRTRAPETECWIFSTHEIPSSQHEPPDGSQQQQQQPHDERLAEAKSQLLALLYAISQLPSPTPLIIIGSFASTLLPLLGPTALVPQPVVPRKLLDLPDSNDSLLTGLSVPYTKWLIAPPPPSQVPTALPPGYTFATLRRKELALTMSRTDIPKTEETLAQLGSLAIRYNPSAAATTSPEDGQGELIAWAFIGVDGSLSSLHVEPAHRGKGLAKAVSKRLFAELAADPMKMGFRPVGSGDNGGGEDGSLGWAESNVAVENRESAGVARGLGGKEGWEVRWVGVNLDRVEGAVREYFGADLLKCLYPRCQVRRAFQ